jgi:hypothetical protein
MILRQVDHIRDDRTIIAKDFFKKETDISLFVGLKVCRGPPGRHRESSRATAPSCMPCTRQSLPTLRR